jgi:uncharacterized coiled-coil DUF342 family protein
MNIDIVDRLRISWTSLTDKQNAERAEAAAEIERLRTQLEMWQDGNIMAESHRDELEKNTDEFRKTITELQERVKTLTVERDEARRECCRHMAHGVISAEDYAKYLNWDCFKEIK